MMFTLRGIDADGGSEYAMDGEVVVDDGCVRRTGGERERVATNVALNRGTGTREDERTSVPEILMTRAARMTYLVFPSQ